MHRDVTLSYIPTKENPADVASRGSSMEALKTNVTWWHDPEWILKPIYDWPSFGIQQSETTEMESADELEIDVECNKETVLCK